jgi:hypothetical protein
MRIAVDLLAKLPPGIRLPLLHKISPRQNFTIGEKPPILARLPSRILTKKNKAHIKQSDTKLSGKSRYPRLIGDLGKISIEISLQTGKLRDIG